MDKLMAKIAATVNVDVDELKQSVEETKDLYSYDERVMQRQAVINFFTTYIAPEEPRQLPNESKVKYTKRLTDFEAKKNAWKFKVCQSCKQKFVYAYHYTGVEYCSLECLDATLRKIGLKLTVGRDLRKRWGIHHPAVVSSDALAILEDLYGPCGPSLDVPDE